jgi:hypothetical protein
MWAIIVYRDVSIYSVERCEYCILFYRELDPPLPCIVCYYPITYQLITIYKSYFYIPNYTLYTNHTSIYIILLYIPIYTLYGDKLLIYSRVLIKKIDNTR